MEKNNSSNFSMCRKIRQAFASSPAFRAIHHRISHYLQAPKPVNVITEFSNSKSHCAKNTAIPIKFDYSTPASKGNGNSEISAQVAPPLAGNSKKATKVAAKVETESRYVPKQGKHPTKAKVVHSEQQGKKTLDVNDTFSEYIQRARYRIRTVSNIGGRGQSNPAAPDNEANGIDNGTNTNNKKENQNDRFSEFIHNAKRKLRTTSSIGNTSSLKRG